MRASTITKTSTSMPDAVDQLLESEAQAAHVVPALRIKGTLVRGRKGDTHEDIMNRIRSEDDTLFLDVLYEPAETGFGSMAMNRFIDSRDPDTADFDRNELFRRYGVRHSHELSALQRGAEEGKSGAADSLSEAERITGAAVMAKDGRVFTGRTHAEAYVEAEKAGIGELDLMPDGGFTTSQGRYVSREEASLIAAKQRQLGKQVDMTDWPEGKPFELDAAMLEAACAKELFRAGMSPDDYDGNAPSVNWSEVDMYGYAWSKKTVKKHTGTKHDYVYPAMLDKHDLRPQIVELEDAKEIRAKNEQQMRADYPDEFLAEDPDDPETAVDWIEVRDRLAWESESGWEQHSKMQMARPRGGYPPAVVRRIGEDTFEVIDGNHRIAVWQDNDRIDVVPAWVVDDYLFAQVQARAQVTETQEDYYVYDGRRVKEHYIWIGNISKQGRVRAVRSPYYKDSDRFGETPTHGMLKLYSGKRWRYPEGSSAVFWWESPTEDDKAQVDAFMRERGLPKVRHIDSSDEEAVTADLHFDLAHGHRSPFGNYKLNRAKSKIRSVREEVDRLLDEALDSPYAKRLAFVVRQYGAIRGFMALDALLSSSGGYYFDLERIDPQSKLSGVQQLKRDVVWMLHQDDVDYENPDHKEAALNAKADTMSDEEFEPMLRDVILGPKGWLAQGKWYEGSVIPDRDPSEPIVPWLAREALRCRSAGRRWMPHNLKQEVVDWFNGARPKPDIFKLTLNQALYRTRRWHAELRRQKEVKDEAESLNTLKWIDLGNGVRMARLGREHLDAEGAAMQNCVGSYKNRSHLNIWSVRRDMKRLYTVEVDANNRIAQFKAKANRLPSERTDVDAALRALSWFARAGVSVVHEQVHDVSSWWNDEGGANASEPYVELDPESKKEALRRYWDDVVCYQVMFDLRYLLEDAFINSGGEDLDTALAGMFTDAPAETTA